MTKFDWTNDRIDLLRRLCEEGKCVHDIALGMSEHVGFSVGDTCIRNAIHRFGFRTKRSYGAISNQDYLDFLYAHKNDTVRDVQVMFNERFGTAFSATKIYRLMLAAKADPGIALTPTFFSEEWGKLQKKLAPNGQERRMHWLWRWRRFDDDRTAAGCVFRGRKVEAS